MTLTGLAAEPTDVAQGPAEAVFAQMEGDMAPAGAQPAAAARLTTDVQGDWSAWPAAQAIALSSLEVEELLAEDDASRSMPGVPMRLGVNRALPTGVLSPKTGGVLAQLPDGSIRWTARLMASGATAIRVHFSACDLPAGGRLVVAGSKGRGGHSYAGQGPGSDGSFWSIPTPGEDAYLEYTAPAGSPDPVIEIDEISQLYREPGLADVEELSCHEDVNCHGVSTAARDSVGFMIFTVPGEGSYVCTGALLNDADPDTWAGYFLTANHCISDQATADSLVVYWFYQTASCNGTPPNFWDKPSTSGATLLAHSENSDFCFMRLADDPRDGQGFSGWTTAAPSSPVTGIHHPDSAYKRVSIGNLTSFGLCQLSMPFTRYHYLNWTTGITEGGSSGSPLYDTDWHIVGQLFGSCSTIFVTPGCDNRGSWQAVYGKFSETYPNISSYLNTITPDDSFEQNDTLGAAKLIGRDSYNLRLIDQYDYFAVRLQMAGPLTVSLTCNATQLVPKLRVTSAATGDLGAGSQTTIYTGSGQVTVNVPPGLYYIHLDKFRKWGGDYTLTVTAPNEDNYVGNACTGSTANPCGCVAGPIVNPYNGHKYYLLEKSTWTHAEAAANNQSGHLVAISDAAEQAWVLSTFGTYGGIERALWIGFTDRGSEGNFTWTNGESAGFTHWNSGEPNNTGDEDFVLMYGGGGSAGLWNDDDDTIWSGSGGPYGVAEVVDCNDNSIDDGCDIASGFSLDANHDGIPDECQTGVDANGWVRDWAVLGPFTGDTLADQLATGCGYTERTLDPSAGNRSTVLANGVWQAVTAGFVAQQRGVDFGRIFGGSLRNAYAHTYLYNPLTRMVRSRIGSDDGCALFIDGIERSRYTGPRSAAVDQDISAPFVLTDGWHRVMVHVANGDGDWGFLLRFDDGAGNILTDLHASPWRSSLHPAQGLPVPDEAGARPSSIRDWLILGSAGEGAFAGAGCDASCASDVLLAAGGPAQQSVRPFLGDTVAGKSWVSLRDVAALNFSDAPLVNFTTFYGGGASSDRVVYLHSYVYNPNPAVQARVAMGSDDSGQVWVNGSPVLTVCTCRGGGCDQDISVPFSLPRGCSRVLLRIDQGTGDWKGGLRLIEATSTDPLAGVSFLLNPITIRQDFDADLDVDNADLQHLESCFTGPALPPVPVHCDDADLDGDGDVDLADFGRFQPCYAGPDVTPDPACE